MLSRLRHMVPLGLRQTVSRCLPKSVHYRMNLKWVNDSVEWERSKVFCIPNANEAYFRLNLRGREPKGIVAPGAEEEALVAELRSEMSALVNPDNGRSAVERVVGVSETFPGPQRDRLPDVTASWNNDAETLGRVRAPRGGVVEQAAGYQIGAYYTGNHRPNAFLVARGPGLPEGVEVRGNHILDVAPTVLALLGVSPPSHFAGRPIPELTAGSAAPPASRGIG